MREAEGRHMQPTSHAEANAVLRDALDRLHAALGDELVAAYLYGSAVAGDFDPARSDLDLLIACASDVAPLLGAIDTFHRGIVNAHPEWHERIDAAFVPVAALQRFVSASVSSPS